MVNFFEVHESTVDAKGRVLLPQAFKNQIGKTAGKGFVIKRTIFSKSLDFYPLATWNAMIAEVKKLNRFTRKNVEFIRLFNAGVKSANLDKSGRFLIPRDLLSYAGIQNHIVLSSAIDHIEIWDKKHYEKFIKENGSRFESLTEEVMGNITPGSPHEK